MAEPAVVWVLVLWLATAEGQPKWMHALTHSADLCRQKRAELMQQSRFPPGRLVAISDCVKITPALIQ